LFFLIKGLTAPPIAYNVAMGDLSNHPKDLNKSIVRLTMINQIRIKNYKSIKKLNLPLKRINVIIGENGAGKSNILESIVILSSLISEKFNNEFLINRGVRMPNAELLSSAFDENEYEIHLGCSFDSDEKIEFQMNLINNDKLSKNWRSRIQYFDEKLMQKYLGGYKKLMNYIKDIPDLAHLKDELYRKTVFEKIFKEKEFVIYSPSYSNLRLFQAEGQLLPLGTLGEGLFSQLKNLYENNRKIYDEIIEKLHLLGWYQSMTIQSDAKTFETNLNIQDKFIREDQFLNQNSVNEGFFFILFYFTLLLSPNTPSFFAIDNIEASLNPKLCKKIMQEIIKISKEKNKQIILTTHNPIILDGLDLNDEEQSLIVVKRNDEGHTIAKSIYNKNKSEKIKLSESFMNGYFGGLPENF
jgi:predicted ATPase